MDWLESVLQDVRFGVRILAKDSVVTIAAVLSLSLATGACTAAFSLIDTFYLRPLPVRDPGRLFYLMSSGRQRGAREGLLRRLREAGGNYIDVFGYNFGTQSVIFDDSDGEEERAQVQSFSGETPQILGVRPTIGRLLTAEDRGRPVAVLTYSFWSRRFGANPSVLGRWLTWRGQQYQIVGVSERGFNGLFRGFMEDLWLPDFGVAYEMIFGHLKPGATLEQARQVLQAALINYRREHPEDSAPYFLDAPLGFGTQGDLRTGLNTQWKTPLSIVASIAGLILLVACSNVSNLLIARAAARQTEMMVRISVGASRGRLIQQQLLESSLIAVTACLLGIGIASAMTPTIVHLMSPSYSSFDEVHINWRVLPFLTTMIVSITVLLGLIPALRASAASKQSGRTRLLRLILASQVSFSFVVLFVGGLLLLSFQKLTHVDLGFAKEGVLLAGISGKIPNPEQKRAVLPQLLDRIRQLPQVQAVGMSDRPLLGYVSTTPAHLAISPGFLDAMQIRLLDGRDLDWHDNMDTVLVNQTFLRTQELAQSRHVVGVVADTKFSSVREASLPIIFEPLRDINGTLEVRSTGNPLAIAPMLRQEIQRIHPALRVSSFMLQTTRIDETLIPERLLALLAGFFSLLAVLLSAVGLYGVLSFSVARRTKEIGIRYTLGAHRTRVVRLVISDFAVVIAGGIVAGTVGGFIFARFLNRLLYGVRPADLQSVALPLVCLLAAAAIATTRPAIRAARVDPAIALRHE